MKLYENIQNELSKKNINVQVGTMYDMMAIWKSYRDWETDRKSTRLNSSHSGESRMPSSA